MTSFQSNSGHISNEDGCTLFLGDLSVYCTENNIRELFQAYGRIENIRIKKGNSTKPHLCYGFIKFETKQNAERAYKELNGVMFQGRSLRVGWAEKKVQPTPQPLRPPNSNKFSRPIETAQIHVSFISKQIDELISEATLRSLFGLYGEVVDVAIKKSQFDKKLKLQNGYGFVHFRLTPDGIRSAINATNAIHQVTIDRVTYDCSLSHSLEIVMHKQPHEEGGDNQGSEIEQVGAGGGDGAGESRNGDSNGASASANSHSPPAPHHSVPPSLPPLVPNVNVAGSLPPPPGVGDHQVPILAAPIHHRPHSAQQQHVPHPHGSHHPSPGLENYGMPHPGAGGEGFDPNLDALTKSFHDSLNMNNIAMMNHAAATGQHPGHPGQHPGLAHQGPHSHPHGGLPQGPPPGSNPYFPSLYPPHLQFAQPGHPGAMQSLQQPYMQHPQAPNPYNPFPGLFYNSMGGTPDGKQSLPHSQSPYAVPQLHPPVSSLFAPSYDLGGDNLLHNAPPNLHHPAISHLQLFPSSDPFHPSPQHFDPVLFPSFGGQAPPQQQGGGGDDGQGQQQGHFHPQGAQQGQGAPHQYH